MGEPPTGPLLKTPLHALHLELGAKMVPFAGYDMPVQYPTGVLTEHNWTREHAGLFDVSHMGQCFLIPADGKFETAAAALEKLVPADVLALKPGQQRYSQFTNAEGGILDDLMVTRSIDPDEDGALYVVDYGKVQIAPEVGGIRMVLGTGALWRIRRTGGPHGAEPPQPRAIPIYILQYWLPALALAMVLLFGLILGVRRRHGH